MIGEVKPEKKFGKGTNLLNDILLFLSSNSSGFHVILRKIFSNRFFSKHLNHKTANYDKRECLMYDIYLRQGANSLPQTLDLKFERPIKEVIEEKLPNALSEKPGFLGLDLSFDTASLLLEYLNSLGAKGRVADSKYRNPTISLDMAFSIAEEAMRQEQEKYSDIKFEKIRLRFEEVMWWEFFSLAKEWLDDGYTPGGLIVWVDKVDGHIWQDGEFTRLYGDRPPSDLRGRANRVFKRFSTFLKIPTLSGKLQVIRYLLRKRRKRPH